MQHANSPKPTQQKHQNTSVPNLPPQPNKLKDSLHLVFEGVQNADTIEKLRAGLRNKFEKAVDPSKTSVDMYYEMVEGTRRVKGSVEEVKKGSKVAYLDKCKRIGRLGPLRCRIDSKNSHGDFSIRGSCTHL